MLKRFAFRAKMLYLCTSEEEEAVNTGLSPLFCPIKGCITSEVEKSLREIEFFLSESGFSIGEVGERIGVSEKI